MVIMKSETKLKAMKKDDYKKDSLDPVASFGLNNLKNKYR
jgi:hypothetical protein